MNVDEAILSRRSVRGFLPKPVPRPTVAEILEVATRAPSGTNIQPWQVYACSGAVRDALVAEVVALFEANSPAHRAETESYPDGLPEPYRGRRRKVGWDLYSLLGVEKGDREAGRRQHANNFRFFGAPVGLFFFVDRVIESGSRLDYGMFIENVMLAARGRGLDTCPQAAWRRFHEPVRRHLGVPGDLALVCGMSLGYADAGAPANQLRTEREPVEGFARFRGFE
ncbi:MAG: nitroreductase [Alphaproteobacteria bacterium]|jgi:nitroreductase|nr:nitroreductase [Alphaproteobacteria bacterium]